MYKKNNSGLKLIFCIVLLGLVTVGAGVLFFIDNKEEKPSAEKDNQTIVVADDTSSQDEVASYEISTKYCKLYFPEIWRDKIEVRCTEKEGYKAAFYGVTEGKESKHLFDVCFDSDKGILLGYLEYEDTIVNISVDIKELEFDDSWNQEEIDLIYSMQEEMNFVIDTLGKNEHYVEP